MDARECYVFRDRECERCNGTGKIEIRVHSAAGIRVPSGCPSCQSGLVVAKVPLIDALRALGIDVPEPEEPIAERCPP